MCADELYGEVEVEEDLLLVGSLLYVRSNESECVQMSCMGRLKLKKTYSWLEVFCVRSNESEYVQIICVGRLKFEEDLLLVGSLLCEKQRK